MATQGHIPISSNFDRRSPIPMDPSLYRDDVADRNAIPVYQRYPNMVIFILNSIVKYQLVLGTVDMDLMNDNNWVEIFDNINPSDYYTKLELDGGQLDNRYYTETEVDSLLDNIDSFKILSNSGNSYASFEPDGTNEYMDVVANNLTVAQFGGSGHSKLILDPSGIFGNTTGLWFSNNDIGFYRSAANFIYVVVGGLERWEFRTDRFESTQSTGPRLSLSGGTATVPTIIPKSNDTNTGIGSGNSDTLSLIAGGIEGIRVNNLTAHSVAGMTNYETLVIDDDDIPNKKWVDDRFTAFLPYQLYQPDGTNPFVYTDNGGNLHVDGPIIQSGLNYEIHTEQVFSALDLIITRDGAVAGLGAGEYTGIQASLYDGANDGQLVFDNAGVARVGDVGSLQPIATREEAPTNGYFAKWVSVNTRFETVQLAVSDISDFANTLAGTNNTVSFTPTADYHVSPKKYVDDAISSSSYYTTVGSGGDYATVQLALAAGKYDLKLISAVTETVNWGAHTKDINLYAEELTILNVSVANTSDLIIRATNISFNVSGTNLIFTGTSEMYFKSCEVLGDTAFNDFRGHISGEDLYLQIGSNGFRIDLYNIIGLNINGLESSGGEAIAIRIFGSVTAVTMTGPFELGIDLLDGVMRDVVGDNQSGIRIRGTVGSSIYNAKGIRIYIRNDTLSTLVDCELWQLHTYSLSYEAFKLVDNCIIDEILAPYGGGNINTLYGFKNIINSTFTFGDIHVLDDELTLQNCKVTNGTIVVDATADKTTIIGGRTVSSITDNGTNTILLANQLL